MNSVIEQGFFHEFTVDNKTLKTFVEFSICRKRSNVAELEHRHISIFVVLASILCIYRKIVSGSASDRGGRLAWAYSIILSLKTVT